MWRPDQSETAQSDPHEILFATVANQSKYRGAAQRQDANFNLDRLHIFH